MITSGQLIAELQRQGINFVVGDETGAEEEPLTPPQFLSGLAAHPDARLRLALIAVLLQKPEFSTSVQMASNLLPEKGSTVLKLYYTAAFYLQKLYADPLVNLMGFIEPLPDLFSTELGLKSGPDPEEQLRHLAEKQTEVSGISLNWFGTYNHVAKRVLARLKKEQEWQVA